MLVLGLLAAALLGLMALRGVAILVAPDSGDPFLLPLQLAIPLALIFGLAVTYLLGRSLGLFGLGMLRDYEAGLRARREIASRPEERAVPETTIKY